MYVGSNKGSYMFVMAPDLYLKKSAEDMIEEAALRTGLQRSAIRSAWYGIAEVVQAWVTSGHAVELPGVGHMRFGVKANAVKNVEDVSTNLIKCRKIIFTPNVGIKRALRETSINITCYDRDGKIVVPDETAGS